MLGTIDSTMSFETVINRTHIIFCTAFQFLGTPIGCASSYMQATIDGPHPKDLKVLTLPAFGGVAPLHAAATIYRRPSLLW